MRRYTKNELLKRNTATYIVTALLILVAVILPFLPDIFALPSYGQLTETEVVITKLNTHYYRGENGHSIRTDDGKDYYLSGGYEYEEIKDVLVPGAKATVKWYDRLIPIPVQGEEITVDGCVVVAYDNDEPVERDGLIFLGSVLALLAVIYFVFSLLWTRHIQRLQDMRDKRIEKKYGKE